MNNIYFYLILIVFLYFIFTRVLENFLVEQENFDPSLVPVSSIVTLAKVAQKLVNGNGTLTNPGNLQIGASTGPAAGNLTVTGGILVNGANTPTVTFPGSGQGQTSKGYISTGTLNLGPGWNNGDIISSSSTAGLALTSNSGSVTVLGNDLVVSNKITTGDNINISSAGNNGININSSNPYISFKKTGATGNPQIYSDGTILHAYNAPFQVDQNLTVMGDTTVGNKLTVNSTTTLKDTVLGSLNVKTGTASPDWTKLQYGDGSGWRVRFQKDDANPIMDIYDNINAGVQVKGNLNVGGALNATGIGTFNNFKIGPIRIQCGYSGGSSQWVYFATPFSGTPVVNAYFASTDGSNVDTSQWAPWAINISATGFQVRNSGNTMTSWFAIGPS